VGGLKRGSEANIGNMGETKLQPCVDVSEPHHALKNDARQRTIRKKPFRRLRFGFIVLFLLPVTTHALWWLVHEHPRSWSEANWSSAGLLLDPARVPDAVVYVLAGRTGRWKGIVAHHTWIVLKPKGEEHYTRYEVVGWGRPVRINAHAPDGRWFGDVPRVLVTLEGAEAERAIPKIRAAVETYPYATVGSYHAWPGPNSNTFIAHIVRQVPELAQGLLPTAIGKDFAFTPIYAGWTPSRTGVQVSLLGLAGVSLGWVEGIEINVLGLVAGLDVRRPALKVPGWGRIEIPLGSLPGQSHGIPFEREPRSPAWAS
jgi:hypothetical protein